MLKKEIQIEYFKNKSDSSLRHFRKFIKTQDASELHQMRVDLKKIKSLLNLSSDCQRSTIHSDRIKKINKVFKAAGKIRSLQLNLKILETDSLNYPDLRNVQLKILKDHYRDFYCNKKDYQKILDNRKEKFAKNFRDIEDKCLLNFLGKSIRKLNLMFSPYSERKNFHKCRKIIKDLIYLNELLPTEVRTDIRINLAYLKDLEDCIGKWHDNISGINFLQRVSSDKEITENLKMKIEKYFKLILLYSENFKEKVILKNQFSI
ncbi:MAG TPA: CHAD domain-containing protein [Ignavibacteria bacterium]|nr:CHAD domain-containing protein [Ignavibacteria bacterium]